MTLHTSNTTILFELSFDIQMLKLRENSKTIVIIKKTKETTERDCGIRGMKRHDAMGLLTVQIMHQSGLQATWYLQVCVPGEHEPAIPWPHPLCFWICPRWLADGSSSPCISRPVIHTRECLIIYSRGSSLLRSRYKCCHATLSHALRDDTNSSCVGEYGGDT